MKNKNVLCLVLKREDDEIEFREMGSLLSHVRGACIGKALSWREERLMRTFVWSLNLFIVHCSCLVLLG